MFMKNFRIISWNCDRAFRKKESKLISKFNPDIAVVPECGKIEQTPKRLWFRNKYDVKKGLGVFSYSDYEIKPDKLYKDSIGFIAPIKVSGHINFTLLAIWTKKVKKDKEYVESLIPAIERYSNILKGKVIIIGDFNWWIDGKADDFSKFIDTLKDRKITSAYHRFFGEPLGKETRFTLWHKGNKKKKYHVDYCFASESLLKKLKNFELGEHREWKSDHVPLIIEFNI